MTYTILVLILAILKLAGFISIGWFLVFVLPILPALVLMALAFFVALAIRAGFRRLSI